MQVPSPRAHPLPFRRPPDGVHTHARRRNVFYIAPVFSYGGVDKVCTFHLRFSFVAPGCAPLPPQACACPRPERQTLTFVALAGACGGPVVRRVVVKDTAAGAAAQGTHVGLAWCV